MLNQKTLTPEKYGLEVVWIFINQIFFLSTEKDVILFKNQISYLCVYIYFSAQKLLLQEQTVTEGNQF